MDGVNPVKYTRPHGEIGKIHRGLDELLDDLKEKDKKLSRAL